MLLNLPLIVVSALFFVVVVSALYLASWAIATTILKIGRRRISHDRAKRILLFALLLPPILAAIPTLGGATLRHDHASALLEHHTAICRVIFGRVFALAGADSQTSSGIAGSVVNGLAWLLVASGLMLLLKLIRATGCLERGITPYLNKPSPRLAAALERVGIQLPGLPAQRFYECAIPAAFSSLLGFWQPRCVISRDFVTGADNDELDAVVAHEASHLRAGDVQSTFFVGGMNCLFFFLRPVRLLSRRWREETELACDAAAVKATRQPLAMAAAILRVSGVPVTPRRPLPTVALAFADEAACSPSKRVEILIAQAEKASLVTSGETPIQAISAWLVTLLFASIGIAMLFSTQALCYAHCALESVARLLP